MKNDVFTHDLVILMHTNIMEN